MCAWNLTIEAAGLHTAGRVIPSGPEPPCSASVFNRYSANPRLITLAVPEWEGVLPAILVALKAVPTWGTPVSTWERRQSFHYVTPRHVQN